MGRAQLLRQAAPIEHRPLDDVEYVPGAPGAGETAIAAVTFAPVGSVVVDALRAVAPGGTVAINAIHLDEIPAFDHDLLWQEPAIRTAVLLTAD